MKTLFEQPGIFEKIKTFLSLSDDEICIAKLKMFEM